MIVYPATSLHYVTPSREAPDRVLLWTQSMILDESKRLLLFDMDMAIIKLRAIIPTSFGGGTDLRLSQPAAAMG